MEQLQNLKGTRDYLPWEQKIRNNIRTTLEKVFELHGYKPLETPILCHHDILASKYAGGAEILKEIYSLTDQGKRDLALRYDLTVPFARFIGMNPQLRQPFKRYEMGKVFRDGPVKAGRLREFVQCDVDVVGIKSMMAEAELISMALHAFEDLELDAYVSYNNRKLLSGILQGLNIPEEKVSEVILALDKIEKIGLEGIEKELLELGLDTGKIGELFHLYKQGKKSPSLFKEEFDNNDIIEGARELEELEAYIEDAAKCGLAVFNPFLARGLEIYTGTVFEVFLKDSSITSSIASGGRYDKIISGFLDTQEEYPAVGISFGLDVIFSALELQGKLEALPAAKYYLIPLGTEKETLNVAKKLREKGLSAEVDMTGRRLKKSLDYANKENIPYVLILGENELEKGAIVLKDMNKGEEEELSLKDMIEELTAKSGED